MWKLKCLKYKTELIYKFIGGYARNFKKPGGHETHFLKIK